ncbi:MAG: hypothetical protein RLZZ142_32, partial [Verrucomicrobiota bacterium]
KAIQGELEIETPRGDEARAMRKAGLPVEPQFGFTNEIGGKKVFTKWTIVEVAE